MEEGIRILIFAFMFICAINVFGLIYWYAKYSNRKLEPFEVIAIFMSMMSIITSIIVLYVGSM